MYTWSTIFCTIIAKGEKIAEVLFKLNPLFKMMQRCLGKRVQTEKEISDLCSQEWDDSCKVIFIATLNSFTSIKAHIVQMKVLIGKKLAERLLIFSIRFDLMSFGRGRVR